MNLLAVDTALSACSVAFLRCQHATVRSQTMARGHAEVLMPMIEDARVESGLAYSDIDRFVVTVGPGTFTGVRVGVAAVRGFALATGRPAVGVTTLEALAATARSRSAAAPLLVVLDARRGELYAQAFAGDGAAITEAIAIPAADLPDRVPDGVEAVFGSGAAIAATAFAARRRDMKVLGEDPFPDPMAVARIGLEKPEGAPPVPLYLRAPDARPQEGGRLARR